MPAKRKILVLESDKVHRTAYEAMFRTAGYAVTSCGDGAAGLVLLRRGRPVLVVTGINLAGKNGYDVIEAARHDPDARLRKIPILVISNLSGKSDIDRALKAGADRYLVKADTSVEDVIGAVKSLLTEH